MSSDARDTECTISKLTVFEHNTVYFTRTFIYSFLVHMLYLLTNIIVYYCSVTLLFQASTITPVTSIICIPLPIGVLGKRGSLEDNNTNNKCHGRE